MDPRAPLSGRQLQQQPLLDRSELWNLGWLVLVPILVFATIICCATYIFHESHIFVWTVVGIGALVSMMLMALRPAGDGPKFWFNLGLLCFLATVIATMAGVWNYNKHMLKYWAYEGSRTYTNVYPTEPGLRHLDAGKIKFSTDAHIDFSNNYTWTSSGSYCVAPIVGKTSQDTIEYWAAGMDCCSTGGNFTCGDASDATAHEGLVFLDDLLWPSFDYSKFQAASNTVLAAIRTQSNYTATYPANVSDDPIFVQWVTDADEAGLDNWYHALSTVAMATFFFGVFTFASAVALWYFEHLPELRERKQSRSSGRQ